MAAIAARFRFYARQTWQEIKTRRLSYALGVLSCLLAVFVFALAQTAVQVIPMVNLKLAEDTMGRADVVLKPSNGASGINFSKWEDAVSRHSSGQYAHSAARISLPVDIYPQQLCDAPFDSKTPMDTTTMWAYDLGGQCMIEPNIDKRGKECLDQVCTFVGNGWKLVVADTLRESEAGIAVTSAGLPVPEGDFRMSYAAAQASGLSVGDYATFRVEVGFALGQLYLDTDGPEFYMGIRNYNIVYFSARFAGPIDTAGRVPSADDGLLVLMEMQPFFSKLSKNLHPRVRPEVSKRISVLQPSSYATDIIVNIPPPRLALYAQSDFDEVQSEITSFASGLRFIVGFDHVDVQLPVFSFLLGARFVDLFLFLIINIITFMLTLLSVVLIYSLLLINVETRIYDLGVMRMIGLSRFRVMELIFSQALAYSLPAWVFGLIVARVCWAGARAWLETLIDIEMPAELDVTAVLGATLLATLVSVFSCIFPAAAALRVKLREALDTQRSKTKAVEFEIDRASDKPIDLSLVIVGGILIFYGFLAYYFFPLALLTQQVTLLLNLFFFIIFGMLMGFVLLALNLERMVENVLVHAIFFWENRAVRMLILKLLAELPNIRNNPTLVARIEETLQSSPIVENFAWLSHRLNDHTREIYETALSNVGQYDAFFQTVHGISPDFYRVVDDKFLHVSSYARPSLLLISEQLYAPRAGTHSGLNGAVYEALIGLNQTPGVPKGRRDTFYLPYAPMAVLDSSPRFLFSQYPQFRLQDMAVGIPTLVSMSAGFVRSVDDMALNEVMIRLRDDVDADSVRNLKERLSSLFSGGMSVSLWDFEETVSALSVISQVLTIFSVFTTTVAMMLCFFSLMSSMLSNIHEQSKDIGVLRSIGTRKNLTTRVYVYEAIVLVLAGSILGIFIGLFIGATMTAQRSLILQLPLTNQVPWLLFVVVVILGVATGILATFGPMRRLLRLNISEILKCAE